MINRHIIGGRRTKRSIEIKECDIEYDISCDEDPSQDYPCGDFVLLFLKHVVRIIEVLVVNCHSDHVSVVGLVLEILV